MPDAAFSLLPRDRRTIPPRQHRTASTPAVVRGTAPREQTPPSRDRVLWIEDQQGTVVPVAAYLSEHGFDVEFAASGEAGLARATAGTYAAVLLDLRLPDRDGMDVLKAIQSAGVRAPVIIITGYGSIESAVEAVLAGAADYLRKPIRGPALVAKLRSIRERLAPLESSAAGFRRSVGTSRCVTAITQVLRHEAPRGDALTPIPKPLKSCGRLCWRC